MIERLQRIKGPAVIPELGIVVVLDNSRVVRLGKIEQSHTAARRHDDAQGKLVAGRHADDACRRWQLIHDKAFRVDGDGDQLRAGRSESRPQRRIARFFNGYRGLPGRHQYPRNQVEGLLGAGGDDNIVGLAGHQSCK